MSLNVSTTDKKVAEAAMLTTMEDIEKRLQEIRKKDRFARREIEVKSEAQEAVDATDITNQ